MPRKNLIRTDEYFYHITTRANNREWFSLPMPQVWQIACHSFQKAQENSPAKVYQFVLMSNHYHLLIQTPNSDIDKFMFWFNKSFSQELRRLTGRENRMFGSSYKWSLIKHHAYFRNVFKYIYQNPLRANIVENCEDYKFSTFYYTSRNIAVPFKFHKILYIEEDKNFINDRFDDNKNQIIKLGLKKTSYNEK